MRNPILSVLSRVDFIGAILEEDGKPSLHKFQGIYGSINGACPAIPLRDFKSFVFGGRRLLEQNVSESRRLELQ